MTKYAMQPAPLILFVGDCFKVIGIHTMPYATKVIPHEPGRCFAAQDAMSQHRCVAGASADDAVALLVSGREPMEAPIGAARIDFPPEPLGETAFDADGRIKFAVSTQACVMGTAKTVAAYRPTAAFHKARIGLLRRLVGGIAMRLPALVMERAPASRNDRARTISNRASVNLGLHRVTSGVMRTAVPAARPLSILREYSFGVAS